MLSNIASGPGSGAARTSAITASRRCSTSARQRLGIGRADRPLGDEPRLERVDRIALVPLVELAGHAVRRRVGARVAGVAVRLGLEQHGAARRADGGDGVGHGLDHRVDVLAVDDAAVHRVGGAPRRQVGDRRGAVEAAVLGVDVVLDDEQHRQLPGRGQVEPFVEGADVRRAVAEDRHGDVVAAEHLGGVRRPGCDRDAGADDGERRQQPHRRGAQVHRPAAATEAAHRPAGDLAEHLVRRQPERQARDRVRGTCT